MRALHLVLLVLALAISGTAASAADFGWLDEFNVTAEADPSGFRVRLATRFSIGDAQVRAVIGDCDRPADAYLVLRYGELSGRPVAQVLEHYRAAKGKGWGVIAQRLGIKPGSSEFKALKRGDDAFIKDTGQKGKDKGSRTDAGTEHGQDQGPQTEHTQGRGHGPGKAH